jgi:hypothetical protein
MWGDPDQNVERSRDRGEGGPVQTGGDNPDRYGRRRFTTWTTGTTRCHEERASMEHSCFGEGTAGFWFLNH